MTTDGPALDEAIRMADSEPSERARRLCRVFAECPVGSLITLYPVRGSDQDPGVSRVSARHTGPPGVVRTVTYSAHDGDETSRLDILSVRGFMSVLLAVHDDGSDEPMSMGGFLLDTDTDHGGEAVRIEAPDGRVLWPPD